MNRQKQIDRFLLDAHVLMLARLREQPQRLDEATETLRRWRAQAGSSRSDAYWDEWDALIREGVDAVAQAACGPGDHAAELRSVSPLGYLISPQERYRLLQAARQSA